MKIPTGLVIGTFALVAVSAASRYLQTGTATNTVEIWWKKSRRWSATPNMLRS